MQFKDYYRMLDVPPTATPEEIKTAYRRLARRFHPDINHDASSQQRFSEISEANEVLRDPDKRAAYDQLRASGWQEGQEMDVPPAGRRRRSRRTPDLDEMADFSEFFQSLFGQEHHGRRGGSGRSFSHGRGDDIHAQLSVTLEESYHGAERQLSLHTGVDASRARTLTVKIPKGVTNGAKIRLRGQGHRGETPAQDGDLYLEIELAEHRLFQVDGRDVLLEVPLAPWEAVLGARIAVPSLGGTVTATIPPGSQPHQKLRLKGRGLPGDPPGDQYLLLSITVPPAASEKAQTLYRALAEESDFHPRQHLRM